MNWNNKKLLNKETNESGNCNYLYLQVFLLNKILKTIWMNHFMCSFILIYMSLKKSSIFSVEFYEK